MKSTQYEIEQEQAALNQTSASYMSMVNAGAPPASLQPDVTMTDPVPEAVAGFISTLGVSLTPEQKDQLQVMLKRPQQDTTEKAKRRKTEGPQG